MIDVRKKITLFSDIDINENDIKTLLSLIGTYFFDNLPQIQYKVLGDTITIHCQDKLSKITIWGTTLRLRCINLPEKFQNQGFSTSLFDFLKEKCKEFNIKCILVESIGNKNMYKLLIKKNYNVIFFNNEIVFEKLSNTDYENSCLYDMYLFIE